MKLSASVPDEWWDRARAVVTEDSPSAVIQAALRQLVGSGPSRPAYAQVPHIDAELAQQLAATRARLQDEVRDLYQRSYRQGLELAGELNWNELSVIAEKGGLATCKAVVDFDHNIQIGRAAPEGARPLIEPRILIRYFGAYADYTGSTPWNPSDVAIQGIDRALRDVLAEVTATGDEVAATQSDQPSAQ